ncbi:uncharacterized protein LOC119995391 [Tripterygium wilfordii]|uniref:uncharacterized protein LOC119995391 n=1 Tax=Tripterygium wilfordii TaxID=458696 RepID=UPI0018F852CE|nr:uncharacterized protein LOC119995391 [Tripterygium wilfordii]
MERQEYSGGRFDMGEGFDAIVVGSGYGGSVAACRMSMAGIKVCVLEKGKRWEAHDFPTDSLKIMSAVRMENRNLGISFGHKDALFQVYEQNNCLAVVACGLGGGSLVNAGVMLPTPFRARRDPKWPKEWERDWDICEAFAAAMLRIQSVPVKFPMGKVMERIVDGEMDESSIKLSVNFDLEDLPTHLGQSRQMNSCLACGNCLSGCPYNAKNSTDKNYLLSAIQAGCIVKTNCQVQYVVKNPYDISHEGRTGRKRGRWLVYLNEIDYISSDFVILSAGVLGTTEILLQSQLRGLKLSESLGSGFSCNGNTVAYLAGSRAPLSAYGLDRKKISRKPFQERPGPSISSSYTSSRGFTIQSAVLPASYPYLLFKGITTNGWPAGYWFFHGIIDKLKHIMEFESSQAMVFNAMGYDQSDGKISLEKSSGKFCFSPPHDPLLPRKIEAFQKLTKKLGGILFISKYRSTSVHLLGGCSASSDSSRGVCSHTGQVFDPDTPAAVHQGLYVCDASLIPCSVGINPSLTIATAAEHVSRYLVQDILEYKSRRGIKLEVEPVEKHKIMITDETSETKQQSTVVFKETMSGYVEGMPCVAYLKIRMNIPDRSHPSLRGKVGGYIVFRAIEEDKIHVIDGEINLCDVDHKTPYTQYMHYSLLLVASSGSRYILEGKKILNPFLFGLYAWRETTTLHVMFKKIDANNSRDSTVHMKGILKISIIELLKTFLSLAGKGREMFLRVFLRTLVRTYILQIPRGNPDFALPDVNHKPYPSSTLHEIETEDGCIISYRQWKSIQNSRSPKEGESYPVLLLNGYATESYWLPTEPDDLIRTLLEEGLEVWLLQSRLHPRNPSSNFTIEDIGRFDIPAVIRRMLDLHEQSIKVHVVAHCVGGLAIHMALMGGHLSANKIASLSCTNSSMFFKLNLLSTVKSYLPLIPISMAILGKDNIIPLLETSKESMRHQIVKFIARLVPRYERCTCKECEVFSGMFGNVFWHQNISPTVHDWLNKQSSTRLPFSPFLHLRKIFKSGYIVDSKGNNSFLIHPERMQLSTLYISGGRSLLVTPETSFLANNYMKLHQPGFKHERVVVEGFGHSDLLIGEEAPKKVFPHILSHIKLAEQGGDSLMRCKGKNCDKEALNWASDPYEYERSESWFTPSVFVFLFILLILMYVALSIC